MQAGLLGAMGQPVRSNSYLAVYPYLFIRETDETDYFCTVCEETLQEIQLQAHLFEGHSAENLRDYFVKIKKKEANSSATSILKKDHSCIYVCVVCWEKMSKQSDMSIHRETCKSSITEDSLGASDNSQPGDQPTSVVSTPDIHDLMIVVDEEREANNNNSRRNGNQSSVRRQSSKKDGSVRSGVGGANSSPQPDVILDNEISGTKDKSFVGLNYLGEATSTSIQGGGSVGSLATNSLGKGNEVTYTSQCMQCSLCSMVLPSSSYISHMRAYHRVSCPLTALQCPLCMTSVPIMDLTVHLAAQHGLVPQTAVNAMLLWALCSNTFSLNDSAQDSLKSKFKTGLSGGLLSTLNSQLTMPKQAVQPQPARLKASLPQAIVASQPAQGMVSLAPNGLIMTIGGFPNSSMSTTSTQPTPGLSLTSVTSSAYKTGQPYVVSAATEPKLCNDLRGKVPVEQLMGKLTRALVGPTGKESHQCLVCSKWYTVPPIKHIKAHMFSFRQEKSKALQLVNNMTFCLLCFRLFDSIQAAASHSAIEHAVEASPAPEHGRPTAVVHVTTQPTDNTESLPQHVTLPGLPGGAISTIAIPSANTKEGGLLGFSLSTAINSSMSRDMDVNSSNMTFNMGDSKDSEEDMSPLVVNLDPPSPSQNNDEVNVELDNAGRVKSGKVRKQCELCGEWSNIKWFFKHMSEIHDALFCRCCREYLPKDEHKEHRHWHGMPPYMGQKIRIENGQPIIIDRKERASLTPIGSLAAWGGSSGGLVVKAVDELGRKRKYVDTEMTSPGSLPKIINPDGSPPNESSSLSGNDTTPSSGRESLMPKERCPVCGFEITHKNLARHIKLRHGIKYKFCYRCKKLIPGHLYADHKAMHEAGEPEKTSAMTDIDLERYNKDEDGVIEIPEEVLDDVLEGGNGNGSLRKKDEAFRTNTSLTKLESLMGREFKHPRRKCNICGYSVSYSNYKRHLRNAHPGEVDDSHKDTGEDGHDLELMGHGMDDVEMYDSSGGGIISDGDTAEGYMECTRCGDHVLAEYMEKHVRMMHDEEFVLPSNSNQNVLNKIEVTKDSVVTLNINPIIASPGALIAAPSDQTQLPANNTCTSAEHMEASSEDGIEKFADTNETAGSTETNEEVETAAGSDLRCCPECKLDLKADELVKHCKLMHKISYRLCSVCGKLILKKQFKLHTKLHESSGTDKSFSDDIDLDSSMDEEEESVAKETVDLDKENSTEENTDSAQKPDDDKESSPDVLLIDSESNSEDPKSIEVEDKIETPEDPSKKDESNPEIGHKDQAAASTDSGSVVTTEDKDSAKPSAEDKSTRIKIDKTFSLKQSSNEESEDKKEAKKPAEGMRDRLRCKNSEKKDDESKMEAAANNKKKIYNCIECARMFMSEEGYNSHLKESHGGEGGHVVLKIPDNVASPKGNEEKEDEAKVKEAEANEEKANSKTDNNSKASSEAEPKVTRLRVTRRRTIK